MDTCLRLTIFGGLIFGDLIFGEYILGWGDFDRCTFGGILSNCHEGHLSVYMRVRGKYIYMHRVIGVINMKMIFRCHSSCREIFVRNSVFGTLLIHRYKLW